MGMPQEDPTIVTMVGDKEMNLRVRSSDMYGTLQTAGLRMATSLDKQTGRALVAEENFCRVQCHCDETARAVFECLRNVAEIEDKLQRSSSVIESDPALLPKLRHLLEACKVCATCALNDIESK